MVLISNIIPFCVLFGGDNNQNITSLLIKIGNELIIRYYEELEYKSVHKTMNKKSFINDLIGLQKNINEEFILDLGSSITEFIANKSNIYKLITVKISSKHSNRIIVPHKNLNENIVKNFGLNIEK